MFKAINQFLIYGWRPNYMRQSRIRGYHPLFGKRSARGAYSRGLSWLERATGGNWRAY